MDALANLALGFGVALTFQNIIYCFIGVFLGTLVGVLPGIGPVTTVAMLLPISFTLPPVSGHDHARRHLLRRAIRRLDHGDPGQHPGRSVVRRHHHRRPPDGAAGPRRAGARHRGDRLVLRRLRRDAAHMRRGAAARGDRARIRAGGIFLAHGLRPDRGRGAGARLGDQGDRHGGARACCSGLPAPTSIPASGASPSACRASPTASNSSRSRWRSTASPRWSTTSNRRHGAGGRDGAHRPRLAGVGGYPHLHSFDPARHHARLAARRAAGRRRAARGVRRLYAGEEGGASRRASSARATSAAWPRPSPPTMPARRPRSFPC